MKIFLASFEPSCGGWRKFKDGELKIPILYSYYYILYGTQAGGFEQLMKASHENLSRKSRR